MAANVENVTLEISKAIQTSISDLRNEMNDRFAAAHKHFDQFKDEARKDRRNINGLMTLLQAASGDFDERIREIDDRVSVLEDRAS